jgi:diguanylate cyclase (GGDEF)-like protein/PAS domain S-box-containing protein
LDQRGEAKVTPVESDKRSPAAVAVAVITHIPGIAALFKRLSLRQRFLVEPLLGLLLLGVLTAAFIFELQHQNALLKRVADENLAAYDHYSEVFVNLSEQHLALNELLRNTQKADEEDLYDAAKQRLNGIHRGVRDLEQALPAATGGRGDLAAQRSELLTSTQAYRNAATSAVTMATVNLALAPAQLARANESFTTMNRRFATFLDAERDGIRSDIAAQVHHGEVSSLIIVLSGAVAAALLIALSFVLSRLLSRALETHIEALVDLGSRAGTQVAIDGTNEVDRIAQAIGAFRQSLLQLRDNEQTLAATNRALTVALDEVGQARDELELRVDARTRDLSKANSAMRAEIELRKEAERHLTIYAEIIRSTGEAVAIADLDGNIIEVNPAYETAIGRSRDELLGTGLYAASAEDDGDASYRELWRGVTAAGHWTGEVLDRRSNGESFPSWALINTVHDERGDPTHYVCVSRDITTLKQNEQQLQKLAFYDTLTQLPNRALFNDRLHVALANAERDQAFIAVMYVDLDRFKDVNDTLGHAAGDRLLIEVAQRISACIRSADTLARAGGDEFTILLSHPENEAAALDVAERIVAAAAKPVQLGDKTVYVGASVGISFYPNDGKDAETLQMNADMAMYEAKEGGRGQCRLFDRDMIGRSKDRMSLSVQIDAALTNDEFSLFYQPIINSSTGQVESAEALIRWQKPGGETILPEKFIRHAEASGLIKKIDCWVLERACRDAVSWVELYGRELSVCVNLSAVSMQQANMAHIIADILQRTKLPPHLLNLEITETAVISDPYAAQRVLGEIVSLGVGMSLDDFGTGYSSLSYLTRFPINCIKLDRAFVDRIGKDAASEEVIRSLLELAARLKLRVVAEGVEQQSQQNFLVGAGCDLMQGFHLVRPMSGAALPDWLAAHGQTAEFVDA